ncbi:aldehyde dehydrogenase family protein [Corynebacterium sp.]|uniref:aldehyde dehydrogenase family protein n=1 Tax=Corynebacterium sp. TaxID=1720 RepID=UPI0026481DD6|nr:aldehyde dehydrogenase family protein [Corynebacterium sp.]
MGVLAPQASSLLGLVSVVAPAIVTGNTAVVLTSEQRPTPAISLAEVLATSDVPGGVVNLISGRTAELAPWLASHRDVNALDLTGAADATDVVWGELEAAAAETLTRVHRPAGTGAQVVGGEYHRHVRHLGEGALHVRPRRVRGALGRGEAARGDASVLVVVLVHREPLGGGEVLVAVGVVARRAPGDDLGLQLVTVGGGGHGDRDLHGDVLVRQVVLAGLVGVTTLDALPPPLGRLVDGLGLRVVAEPHQGLARGVTGVVDGDGDPGHRGVHRLLGRRGVVGGACGEDRSRQQGGRHGGQQGRQESLGAHVGQRTNWRPGNRGSRAGTCRDAIGSWP